jgi:mercuric reductase
MGSTNKVELDIEGMSCEDCALHVEKALQGIPGVKSARVPGWESGRAVLTLSDAVEAGTLEQTVREAGYTATIVEDPVTMDEEQGQSLTPGTEGNDSQDLMVIGAGSAGFAAAIRAAELGFRVTMVEAGTIGGTCVNVGCVPSKTLIRSVEQVHRAGSSPFRGVSTRAERLDWKEVINQKDELVARLRGSKYTDVLSAYPQITYLAGRARLVGGNNVEVDGRTYQPRRIILATGASPWVPSIPGLEGLDYLTSTTAMESTEVPGTLIVVGANAVGLEMAQLFVRAGSDVTLVELEERIAPNEDEEASSSLRTYLVAEGIRVETGFRSERVEKTTIGVVLHGTQQKRSVLIEAERLLVATGRRPNTEGLGLEPAGIQTGPKGEVLVDENLKTSNSSVYAAGDVTGRDMFVYVAAYAGALASDNALGGKRRVYDTAHIPRVIFTDPQMAAAGLTEEQARSFGHEVRVTVLPMAQVPQALAARDMRGMVKLVADRETDRLLGAHIVAPPAGEMIQVAVMALRFGLKIQDLRDTMFPYLTGVEAIKLAALTFEKDIAKLSCCAG